MEESLIQATKHIGGLRQVQNSPKEWSTICKVLFKESRQQHLTQAKSKPAEIAESIKAACFPSEGEFIVPRKEWLIEWCRQLRACR